MTTTRVQWCIKIRPDLREAVNAFAARVEMGRNIIVERALEAYLVDIEDRIGDEHDRLDAEILRERRLLGDARG
jgi:hypothetical protein